MENPYLGRRKMSDDDIAKLFLALSSPFRIKILKALRKEDRYFLEIAEMLGILHSAAHFHLKKLSKQGLVSQERDRGKYVITQAGEKTLELIEEFSKGTMASKKSKGEVLARV